MLGMAVATSDNDAVEVRKRRFKFKDTLRDYHAFVTGILFLFAILSDFHLQMLSLKPSCLA